VLVGTSILSIGVNYLVSYIGFNKLREISEAEY
jgi:magnesium-transporting ATPase (P-type)